MAVDYCSSSVDYFCGHFRLVPRTVMTLTFEFYADWKHCSLFLNVHVFFQMHSMWAFPMVRVSIYLMLSISTRKTTVRKSSWWALTLDSYASVGCGLFRAEKTDYYVGDTRNPSAGLCDVLALIIVFGIVLKAPVAIFQRALLLSLKLLSTSK